MARFILVSGVSDTALQAEAVVAGAVCLTRPVRPSDLLDALSDIVSGESAAQDMESSSALDEDGGQEEEPLVFLDWPRVLIAEDNPVNQHVVEGMLQQLGFSVDIAANGVDIAANGLEAVEKVRQGGYVAVLMDCQMPTMDGFEATRIIRQEILDGDPLPIIALTANVTRGYREECLAAGMDAYLSKPFKQEQLARLLKLWVKTPRGGDGGIPAEWSQQLQAGIVAMPTPSPQAAASIDELMEGEELRSLFLASAREQLDLIKTALAANDSAGVYRGAHSLKGSAGMVEADALQRLAATVEQRADSGHLAKVPPLLEQMEAVLYQMHEAA
ncbi:MAG TPA: response regulator [Rhodothermales bacterium]|nr:response regulator [Rhodothermales bacterium]